MRAVAQDREAAALQGIGRNFDLRDLYGRQFGPGRGRRLAFGPSFCGQSIFGDACHVERPGSGGHRGLGSIPGAILGGLLLGFVESIGYTFLGGITEILGFAIVMLVLLFRPQGLLGHG